MHHLSILVSVCMKMKNCRILNVALGDGGSSELSQSPGGRFHWEGYCGWIPQPNHKEIPPEVLCGLVQVF